LPFGGVAQDPLVPQDCVEGPAQPVPPQEGEGLVQDLLWLPLLQALQPVQPPFIGLLVFEQKDDAVPALKQVSVVQELPSLQSEF
jgi:hypothetical protein